MIPGAAAERPRGHGDEEWPLFTRE
jgi:hypothetical protein